VSCARYGAALLGGVINDIFGVLIMLEVLLH
jgi:hypothetical protein